jgi:hypothetical protein
MPFLLLSEAQIIVRGLISNNIIRSLKRDTEIQVYIYSKCPKLKKELLEEKDLIFKDGKKMTSVDDDKEMPLTLFVRMLAKLMKSLL